MVRETLEHLDLYNDGAPTRDSAVRVTLRAVGLRTPLCDLLGIEHPILNVGFAAAAVPELAAAVSNAGGLGVLGVALPLDEIHRRITRTRELTSRPFGGNIIIADFASPHVDEKRREYRRSQIDVALELRLPVLVLFWGDPAPFVRSAHDAGTKLLVQVGTVEEAAAAANAGVDAVIMQGSEAGGHVKATRSIWENLPDAVAATKPTPVIASGGIGDGRAIARALAMGAQGVSLGTRFVASEEAWIHAHYKRRVVEASAADTFYSPDLYDVGWKDAPHRTIKNRTFARWDAAGRPPSGSRPGEGEIIGTLYLPWGDVRWQRYSTGMAVPTFDGDPEDAPIWAGLSVDQVNDIRPAGQIVRDLVHEAEEALGRSRSPA
ncbi:MAG TPA: nitronate monooxygenase [Candidatus Limnocylindria bacterium]|nr:nitronate monooxygenase [Candidatus Limnocylindria bacterium]